MEHQLHGARPGGDTSRTSHDYTNGKPYATLTARFALIGRELTQSTSVHGAAIYQVIHRGVKKELPDLDAVHTVLIEIGG